MHLSICMAFWICCGFIYIDKSFWSINAGVRRRHDLSIKFIIHWPNSFTIYLTYKFLSWLWQSMTFQKCSNPALNFLYYTSGNLVSIEISLSIISIVGTVSSELIWKGNQCKQFLLLFAFQRVFFSTSRFSKVNRYYTCGFSNAVSHCWIWTGCELIICAVWLDFPVWWDSLTI